MTDTDSHTARVARASEFPFTTAECNSGGVALPNVLIERVRREAKRRGVLIKTVLYEVVRDTIDRVEAEPRTRAVSRMQKYESGRGMLNYSLPLELHCRLRDVADTIVDPNRVPKPQFTGTKSYVFRRCIALGLPDASHDAPAPLAPNHRPTLAQTRKELLMASALMVIPLPPAVHKWMLARPLNMSDQIRQALARHLTSVSTSDKLNRTDRPPGRIKDLMPVPVRVPLAIRDQLRAASLARAVSMSAIARVCVALYVKESITSHQPPATTHA